MLFAYYRDEKSTNALGTLPGNFEEDLQEFVSVLKEKSKDDGQALKELDSAKKLILSLIRGRFLYYE